MDQANDGLTGEQLRRAKELGVITADQLERLQAMVRDDASRSPSPVRAVPTFALVLYWAGAFAVLFALGYFLVDRWQSLQPAGVLAVVTAYGLAFALASRFLSRLGYGAAGSLFALLAVGMTPIVAWSLESLAGWWPSAPARRGPFTTDVLATIRWIPIELTAALAGLVALRRVPLPVLTLAVTIPGALALVHLTPLVFDAEHDWVLWGWVAILAAGLLVIAAVDIERRVGRTVDHAQWAHLTALVFLMAGIMAVTGQSKVIQHSLPAVVALLVTASLAARRTSYLVFAGLLFIGWLGFLASEVFSTATGFMVVVVAAGGLLILGTVLIQSRFPGLARRLSDAEAPIAHRRLYAGAVAASVAALVLLFVAEARAPGLMRERMERERVSVRERAQSRRAQQRSTPTPDRPAAPETQPHNRP